MGIGFTLLESWITFLCSVLSVIGSVLVLCSYLIASTQSNAKAAQLIRNLALTDFAWFTCAIIISSYWLFDTKEDVPAWLCYILAPMLMYLRMASLLWTCAISFDVLMSVKKRKWLWSDKMDWAKYRYRYYALVYLLPFPGAAATIIQSIVQEEPFGCRAGYEPMGVWYLVFLMELLPISLGFFMNIYVFIQIRAKMSLKAFPQSVRKRRRLVMYHYMVVCIICWTPTMIFYIAEIFGIHCSTLELVARTSLYLTGLLNFIVFGLQDPHLKRSFQLVLYRLGLRCLLPAEVRGVNTEGVLLKQSDLDKNVCFEETTISGNADITKDKKNIYRHHKLTKSEKARLYQARPDLNPSTSSMDDELYTHLLADGNDSESDDRKKSKSKHSKKNKVVVVQDIETGHGSTSSQSSVSSADASFASNEYSEDDSSTNNSESEPDDDEEEEEEDRISLDLEDDTVETSRDTLNSVSEDVAVRARVDSTDLAKSRFSERVRKQEERNAKRLLEEQALLQAVNNPMNPPQEGIKDGIASGSGGVKFADTVQLLDLQPDSTAKPGKDAAWGTWTPGQSPPPRQELSTIHSNTGNTSNTQPIPISGADSLNNHVGSGSGNRASFRVSNRDTTSLDSVSHHASSSLTSANTINPALPSHTRTGSSNTIPIPINPATPGRSSVSSTTPAADRVHQSSSLPTHYNSSFMNKQTHESLVKSSSPGLNITRDMIVPEHKKFSKSSKREK